MFFFSPHYTTVMCGGEQPVWEVRCCSSWAWWRCMLKSGRRGLFLWRALVLAEYQWWPVSYQRNEQRMTAGAHCGIISHNHNNQETFSLTKYWDTDVKLYLKSLKKDELLFPLHWNSFLQCWPFKALSVMMLVVVKDFYCLHQCFCSGWTFKTKEMVSILLVTVFHKNI